MRADWYRNATIYAVDVEKFQDSDGDGVGDFPGLIDRLDYLSWLGVDCLWLLPFYPSPNRDNGYDVADYYGVHPEYGTPGDVEELVTAAEDSGIRVVMDLVVNHTSDQHRWFQRARGDRESPYRDYYIWADEDPPTSTEKGTVFPGEEERVWTYDQAADAYYYHRFYHFQPELNLANPEVRDEIRKVVHHWMKLGVAGFRVDAATLMVDPKVIPSASLPDPHGFFRELHDVVTDYREDGVLLAEADDHPDDLAAYFGDPESVPSTDAEPGSVPPTTPDASLGAGTDAEDEGDADAARTNGATDATTVRSDEFQLLFNFVLNAHLALALARERADALERAFEVLPDVHDTGGQWANFLRNLDELNVGRLTPEGKREVFERFAPAESQRIYDRGVRRRLAPMLDGDVRRLRLAFSLLFSLPGAPLFVYGDEIGMGDDPEMPGRTAVRSPMQWADRPNAGFSTADPERLVAPVLDDGEFGYERVNVDDQRSYPDSLLHWVRRLCHLRPEVPEVGHGETTVLPSDDDRVFVHACEWRDTAVVALHNLSGESASATLAQDVVALDAADCVLGDADLVHPDADAGTVTLPGYDFCWLRGPAA